MPKRQKMKEWQKLLFNAIFNIAAALIVGGFLKLMLDFKSIIASVVVVIMGIYLMLFYHIFSYENRKGTKWTLVLMLR